MPSWNLENAEEIRKANPYTFYRPSEAIIDKLKVGDIVKLIFNFKSDDPELPTGERMWVIIESINKGGTYKGKLDNDPYHIKDLKSGDEIEFNRDHIIQYDTLEDLDIHDDNEGKLDQYFMKCYVSNHIMKDGYKVGRLYKEEPENESETGWTFMSDHETQEYVDDYQNLQYISIGKVLNLDNSFIHLLDEPVGSEFARDEITGAYYSIN
jgi:hypothetical protein